MTVPSEPRLTSADSIIEYERDYARGTDADGVVHVIPWSIVQIGIDICEEAQDPFDPSYAPSAGAMARAYIAMARALASLPPAPKP